jgi:hypothetical protein
MNILLAPHNRPCYDPNSLKCYEAKHYECSNDICRAVQNYGIYVFIAIIICLAIVFIKVGNNRDI